MRARHLAFLILGCGLAIGAACTFPDVTYRTTDADAGPSTDAGEVPESGPSQPDVDPNGSKKDAEVAGDAAIPVDAAGCTTCDCDKDGFDRLDEDAGCTGNPPDCDDLIAAIHPKQTFIREPWPKGSTHTVAGDWDCDGTVTRQYDYSAACASAAACGNGFADNPECGATSTYQRCEVVSLLGLGLSCKKTGTDEPGTFVQGCH